MSLQGNSWTEPPAFHGLFKIIQCRIVLQARGESGDLCETSVCNPFLTPLPAQPTPS